MTLAEFVGWRQQEDERMQRELQALRDADLDAVLAQLELEANNETQH
jgi:hypothetical protein